MVGQTARGPPAAATAEWHTTKCHSCGEWTATLTASRALGPGAEITVHQDPHIVGGRDLTPWEVTIDVGAFAKLIMEEVLRESGDTTAHLLIRIE